MSEFKTKAEITSANEFIGYLEQLKSGGVTQGTPGVGTNRALERLSENDNALLEALQSTRFPVHLSGGGTVTWVNPGTLTWTSLINITVMSELNTVLVNEIAAGNQPGLNANDVLYVILDRTTEGAALTLFVDSVANYVGTILPAAGDTRLDHFVVAFVTAQGIVFANGDRLRIGQSFLLDFYRDDQYGQQTELTQVREQQLDNLKLMLVGGGDISWDIGGPHIMSWTGTFQMLFPAQGTGKFELSAGSKTLTPGDVVYLTLDRNAASGPLTDASLGVIAIGSLVETDDTFVLAYHNADDSKLYLWDGTSLNDGDVVQLGGVRSGVQWFFKGAGTAAAGTPAIPNGQITDFDAALPGTSYKVGTGELMVYRNGVKARASLIAWEGGVYPGLGALTGPVEDYDEYVEEDPNGDGTGTRIIWLRDNTPDGTIGHPSATHDPPWTWPKTLATGDPDFLEAFVGIQGNQRSVSNVDGIYGFEELFTDTAGARVYVGGGVLVTAGDPYHHLTGGNVYADPDTDIVPTETLPSPGWAYLYLKPGAVFGGPPELVFSEFPPETASLIGVHPSEADHRFISSVYMDTASAVRGIAKSGGAVSLSRGVDASAAFAGLASGWNVIDMESYLPATWPSAVRLRIGINATGVVSAGETYGVSIRGSGYSDSGRDLIGIKSANGAGTFYVEFDVPLIDSGFEIDVDIGGEIDSVPTAEIVGYFEGRHSAALELGG